MHAISPQKKHIFKLSYNTSSTQQSETIFGGLLIRQYPVLSRPLHPQIKDGEHRLHPSTDLSVPRLQ